MHNFIFQLTIKNNYFPIIINSKYDQSDDLAISLLLVHELTHVQQYLDSINKKIATTCLDNEVNAFTSVRHFYVFDLNFNEQTMVDSRIKSIKNSTQITGFLAQFFQTLDAPYKMINMINELVSNSTCQEVDHATSKVHKDCG